MPQTIELTNQSVKLVHEEFKAHALHALGPKAELMERLGLDEAGWIELVEYVCTVTDNVASLTLLSSNTPAVAALFWLNLGMRIGNVHADQFGVPA